MFNDRTTSDALTAPLHIKIHHGEQYILDVHAYFRRIKQYFHI